MSDERPFADIVWSGQGFSLPELKWRELVFVGALRPDGDGYVRDPARPISRFLGPEPFPPAVRLRVEHRGGRVWVTPAGPVPREAHLDPDHPGPDLARAIEAAAAATLSVAAGAAACLAVGGGVAAVWPGIRPGATALGLGLAGPVAAAELDRMEAFFGARAEGPAVDLCPFADPSLFAALGERGYRAEPGGNVLARSLRPDRPLDEPHLPVSEAAAADDDACRALAPSAPLRAGRAHVVRMGARVVALGFVRVESGVAWLFGDATAEDFRGRGFQVALVRSRLRRCAGQAHVAAAEAAAGSACQRNYERAGFRVAYTRLRLRLPKAS
jgi:GNAT superfamily N-acetyltransferase